MFARARVGTTHQGCNMEILAISSNMEPPRESGLIMWYYVILCDLYWLVVWNMFYSIQLGIINPNWRTPSFWRGVGWNHQQDYIHGDLLRILNRILLDGLQIPFSICSRPGVPRKEGSVPAMLADPQGNFNQWPLDFTDFGETTRG